MFGLSIDASGDVLEKIEYDVYGRMTGAWIWDDGEEVWDAIDQSGAFLTASEYFTGSLTKNALLFQGRRLDEESGLHYFRNRYYDSTHGRFLSRDPMGYADSHCLYQFCNNNPINYTDPMGEFWPEVINRAVEFVGGPEWFAIAFHTIIEPAVEELGKLLPRPNIGGGGRGPERPPKSSEQLEEEIKQRIFHGYDPLTETWPEK